MPVALIEVKKKYTPEQGIAIMNAVYSAITHAFKVPHDIQNLRLVVHEPYRIINPPHLEKPELYTLISIDCFSGRSLEAKRNLYRMIVDNLEALGIPRQGVKIILHEIPKENWGVLGGQAACDVELDYQVEV